MTRSVFIGIPAYTGQVHLPTMKCLIADIMPLATRGDSVRLHGIAENPIINDVRAMLVAHFLASDCTELVFIDSDMTWENGSLARLLDAPVDFVGAAGPTRTEPIKYAVCRLDENKVPSVENGLVEVAGVGTAFLRLSRRVAEKMVAHYADTEFDCRDAPNGTAWALFDPYHTGRKKLSEDLSFCQRWRDIGGRVFVIPDIRMGHIGLKTFTGSFADWLANQNAGPT